MDSICRLCAGIKKIECFVNNRDLLLDLNAKLEKCCQFAINENDGLPQNVCGDCFQNLDEAWKFVTKVHEAQESLHRIFFSNCNKKESSAKKTKILRKISKPIYQTTNIHPVAEISSEASLDDNNEESSASNNYETGNISTPIKIEEFQMTEEFEGLNDDPVDEYEDNDMDNTCDDDSTNFDSEIIPIKEHIQNSSHQLDNDNEEIHVIEILERWSDYPWHCKVCSATFENSNDIQTHSKEFHNKDDIPKFSCIDCSKNFDEYNKYLNHIKAHHKPNLMLCCDICSQFFTDYKMLAKHRRTHDEHGVLSLCEICGKAFKNAKKLQIHSSCHQSDDGKCKMTCDICGKKFSSRPNLKAHQKIHAGIKEFICDQCGKSFVQKANLAEHMLTHSKELPYGCTDCDKKLVRKAPKKKKMKWTTENMSALLVVWRVFANHLKGAKKNMHIYNQMCKEMAKKGFTVAPKDLRVKINNLTQRYRPKKRKHLFEEILDDSGSSTTNLTVPAIVYNGKNTEQPTSNYPPEPFNESVECLNNEDVAAEYQNLQETHVPGPIDFCILNRIPVLEKEISGLHVKLDNMMCTINNLKGSIGRKKPISEDYIYEEEQNIFPFLDVEQIFVFEQRLQNVEFFRKMKMLLLRIVGKKDIPGTGINAAYKLVDVMFSRSVLTNFTWTGNTTLDDNINKKKAFISLKNIIKIFSDVVFEADRSFTSTDNENFFKSRILKYAKSRAAINVDDRKLRCSSKRSAHTRSRRFKTSTRLSKHRSVHLNLKPYKCEDCGREFREKDSLRVHMRIHTGVMPYECDFCGKKFRFRSILTTHRHQHTGVRPYSCQDCNHHFTNWPNYNKHMKRVHGINTSSRIPKDSTESVKKIDQE